ncbi:MAG: hypothetical protein ACLFSA_11225 [Spirochaetaceae bacterium]
MRCRECREILFSIAEDAADKTDDAVEKNADAVDKRDIADNTYGGNTHYAENTPEAFLLPKEVRQHLKKCTGCASLAEALRLTLEENAMHVEPPAGLAERVAASVIDQPVDQHVDQPKDSTPKVITHSFGFRRAASLAAAAILLVAVSVTVTLMVSGNGPGIGGPGGHNAGVENVAAKETSEEKEIPEQEVVTIHLTLEAPSAKSVAVVGDWNDWNTDSHLMSDKNGDGIWELQLKVERGGEYKYQFLVNGEKWIPDPNAPLQVEDGFGGTNSILNI